jgi:hypothetical protein
MPHPSERPVRMEAHVGGTSREEHIALFFRTQRCEASGSDMPSDVW